MVNNSYYCFLEKKIITWLELILEVCNKNIKLIMEFAAIEIKIQIYLNFYFIPTNQASKHLPGILLVLTLNL